MSHINFDFLTDSILFGSNLEDDFEALNEGILREELARYREYVLENFNEIKKEVIMDNRKITVTIESFGKRPDNNILKQLALYIDWVGCGNYFRNERFYKTIWRCTRKSRIFFMED